METRKPDVIPGVEKEMRTLWKVMIARMLEQSDIDAWTLCSIYVEIEKRIKTAAIDRAVGQIKPAGASNG
jgi:hypothetical protein